MVGPTDKIKTPADTEKGMASISYKHTYEENTPYNEPSSTAVLCAAQGS